MVDGKTEEVVNISSMEENDEKRLFGIYARDRSYHIRNIIFNRYVYLVEILAKKYVNRGVEYQDLFQIASIRVRIINIPKPPSLGLSKSGSGKSFF